MKEFNIKPGREVGKIKSAIENAILDGLIENNYDGSDIIKIPSCLEKYFGSDQIKIN